MQRLDHPNIVKYFETYDDIKYIYLCMELCQGGELFQHVIESKESFTEKKCAEYFMKLAKALEHCHSQGIIHRDIKPENIMFDNHGEVKFIDFGLATVRHKAKSDMDIAGTPYYIAPEVLTYSYGKECDIWSLGICIYQLLTGKMPFNAGNQEKLFAKIKSGKFDMPPSFSNDLQDLLKKMIEVDPKKRITA